MGCLATREVPYVAHTDGATDTERGRVTSLSSDDEEQMFNDKIEKRLKSDAKLDSQVRKLLLLGTGSSGKSTLFKQLKQIYHEGVDITDPVFTFQIRKNCSLSIITLLKNSQILYDEDPDGNADCRVDLEADELTGQHIQCVLNNQLRDDDMQHMDKDRGRLLCESIGYLWSLDSVRATFLKRHKFSFIENMDYYFSKLEVIFSVDYAPSLEDVLKSRARTTGLNSEEVTINKLTFKIFDAGGQRSERRKWIQMFDGVTAVLFVAALNHYSCVLFEDENKNAMVESLELFDVICNSKWFRNTEMILFLNKKDVFDQRLREGVSLRECFGESWTGEDYGKRDDVKEDEEEFERYSMECANFVADEYRKLNRSMGKKIFVHVTTATDQDNVEKVFWDVQNIIVSKNLQQGGLVC